MKSDNTTIVTGGAVVETAVSGPDGSEKVVRRYGPMLRDPNVQFTSCAIIQIAQFMDPESPYMVDLMARCLQMRIYPRVRSNTSHSHVMQQLDRGRTHSAGQFADFHNHQMGLCEPLQDNASVRFDELVRGFDAADIRRAA